MTNSARWGWSRQSATLAAAPSTAPARMLTLTRPAPPRSLEGRAAPLEVLEDDLALHLARALADLVHLDVSPEARHGIFVHEAVAAVDLHRLIAGALGRLGGVELGH